MKEIIPKLKELYVDTISATNIDDIFIDLAIKGYKKIIVDRETMFCIARFCVANMEFLNLNIANKIDWEKLEWPAWEILRTGKVDYFWGIKLYLDDKKYEK